MNKGSHQGCHKQVSKREIIMMRTIKHILIPIIVSLSISACDYGVDKAYPFLMKKGLQSLWLTTPGLTNK